MRNAPAHRQGRRPDCVASMVLVRYRCDAVVSDRQVSVACRERVRSLHVLLGTVGCARLHGQALRADAMFSMWRHIVQQRPELLPQLMTGLAQAPPTAALRPSGRQRVVGLNRSARKEMRVAVSGALRDRPDDVEICLTACNNINHATRSTQHATRTGFCKGHQALSSKWR